VPGTAAGALRAAGLWAIDDEHDFDSEDWWFRCTVPDPNGDGPWRLRIEGLATLGDVWLGRRHVLRTENMFRSYDVDVDSLPPGTELLICCRALRPLLTGSRPRPRWKTRLVRNQSLRWFRTTLLGRMPGWSPHPAPVGPWRPVRLESAQQWSRPRCDARRLPGGGRTPTAINPDTPSR
jgi:beta-mannosidase